LRSPFLSLMSLADSHYSYSVMQDEHIRILLKQFYDTFCKVCP
jgi:hypothetical protein